MLINAEQLSSLLPFIALGFGALGFVVVLLLVPVIVRTIAPAVAARRELHQTHKVPIPRLGGIALCTAFMLSLLLTFLVEEPLPNHPRLVLGLTALAMFVLGLWDDISPLGARKKLLGQVLIAVVAFYCGLKVETFKSPFNGEVYSLGMFSCVATVFWLVAMTNLINLIDGIDGLATGISLMLMCLLVYVGWHGNTFSLCLAISMVGALVAFLYFNFPPAKIYLGDGGAYFLGYLIGGLAIQNSNKGTIAAALIAPIFALALPILDVCLSIVRRGLKGLPIFRPDRRHIHHRLLHAGWSRRRAVLTLYGVSLVFLAIAFVAFWSDGKLTPILIGCGFVVVIVAIPSMGLIKNWLTIGTAFGNSLEMRKEIQYALLLRKWMEKEADRCASLHALWQDFTFAATKLRFSCATLTHRGETCVWDRDSTPAPFYTAHHELQIGRETVLLNLFAPKDRDVKLFNLQAELAAEMWQHAMQRWIERTEEPLQLPSAMAEPVAVPDTIRV